MGNKNNSLLFIVILVGVSFFYNYHEIVFKRPQSVHKWRQSDCASIALNYYQDGMRFFKPETHNLTSDNGTTGKCVTSEIPILYYSVALLYKVFGYHDFIYRILNTLLFFLGLFYLFRLLRYLLKDVFWAIALSLLFFTSPVLVYYGNNFLTNSSALAFSIIAWYYFVRFSYENKPKWFYISMIVFFLAAAFKVTALLSLFAICGIFFLELVGVRKFKAGGKIFNQPLRFSIPIFSIFIIIGIWLFYAIKFNQKHDCTYFSTTIFPLWNLDKPAIIRVLYNIRNIWMDQYFHLSVLVFITICFLFILTFFNKNNKVLIISLLIVFAESILYTILQFYSLRDHDYFVIDLYILPVLIIITTFDLLKRHFYKFFNSVFLKIAFSLFLIFNIYYAHQEINARYYQWMKDNPQNMDLYTITPYLRHIGVSSKDTVISIPDASHVSLYLMNQKGWTEYSDAKFNRGPRVNYNQDSAGIQSSINKGAKYLIINGIKELYYKPYLQGFCTNLAGQYREVMIFNLKNRERNFSLEKRKISKIFTCNTETLSDDGLNFVNKTDSTIFQYGTNRSNLFAHSGRYSCKTDASSPYGMTLKLKNLVFGESFSISVWKIPNNKIKGGLVASSSPNPFYFTDYKILEKDSDGWEKIRMEFLIPKELANQELTIYVFNSESETVYFDDLEIIRYKSVFQ